MRLKRTWKNVMRRIAALCMSAVIVGWGGRVSYAVNNADLLEYGIVERINESGITVREYDSKGNTLAYSRSQKDDSWVESMLATMGMSEVVIQNLSEEALALYASEGKMYALEAYYAVDKEGNSVIVSKDVVEQNLSDSTRTQGSTYVKEYDDNYIHVYHTVWVSENGNTIRHSTTADWESMPVNRYTDSLASCTQSCSVREETMQGYRMYHTGSGSVRVDFVGLDQNGNFTGNTEFQLVTDGDFTGVGVTFPMPSHYNVPVGVNANTLSGFSVHMEYEVSPYGIDLTVGEELSVIVYYCHTTLQIGADPSLSINGDFSITPALTISHHNKDMFFDITVP